MWQKKLIISGVSEIVLKNDYEDYEEIGEGQIFEVDGDS